MLIPGILQTLFGALAGNDTKTLILVIDNPEILLNVMIGYRTVKKAVEIIIQDNSLKEFLHLRYSHNFECCRVLAATSVQKCY